MKILVAIKQVPARDSRLVVDTAGNWVDESDLTQEMNEPDAYALEEALQLKETHGGEVVVVSVGPDSAGKTIREALAKGADRAIHILVDEPSPDPMLTAHRLAKVADSEKPDLLLTGLQSDDVGYGQTGVMVAELLGLAHATLVMEVQVAGNNLRVKRELEDGWSQYVTLPMPAVLTIQSGINKLRYATLMGIKKAKTKEIKIIPAPELGIDQTASIAAGPVYAQQQHKTRQVFTGPAAQVAQQLVVKLRDEVRIV